MLSTLFKTIFVHIPKTAGQSIECVFLEKHGLTWKTRKPLLLRANDDPAKGPGRLAHLYAREYVECGHVTAEDFAAFYKFSVVRNPYDRVLSLYRYRGQKRWAEPMSFPDFIEERVRQGADDPEFHNMAPQATFLCDRNGKIIVDEVIRFEDLPGAFAPIARRLFGEAVELPHVNRSKGPDAADQFDGRLRRIVRRAYEDDFDLFGYPARYRVAR